MTNTISALIADDEPLLREILEARLAAAWPELQIVAQARNGRQAIELFEQHLPTICFLDMHMPGLNGIEVARHIGKRSHLVFVTAFDQYALDAFEHGVLDYLVKPVTAARLAETVERLKARTANGATGCAHRGAAGAIGRAAQARPARDAALVTRDGGRLVAHDPVDDIDYLKSDTKYTLVAFRDEGQPAEALIRMPLKDLIAQLDQQMFAQVHRSVAVTCGRFAASPGARTRRPTSSSRDVANACR